jgi:hypothetical protein
MQRRQYLAWLLGETCVGFVAISAAGCGTIFHPERRGQPHGPFIDWKIVALDGLGLLLFFIPGVVAFAVDFYTGAIYLPMDQVYPAYGAAPPAIAPQANLGPAKGLQVVSLERNELQWVKIEQVVSHHVGRPVSLDGEASRVSQLRQIDDFPEHLKQHHQDLNFGQKLRKFLTGNRLGKRELEPDANAR